MKTCPVCKKSVPMLILNYAHAPRRWQCFECEDLKSNLTGKAGEEKK